MRRSEADRSDEGCGVRKGGEGGWTGRVERDGAGEGGGRGRWGKAREMMEGWSEGGQG